MSGWTLGITIAGVVIGAAGTAYSSYVANDNAIDAEKAQKEQAAQVQEAAQTEAQNIREKGRRIAATQEASLAGSGVKLDGSGSGAALLTETKNLAEKDALAVIATGKNQSRLLEMGASASADKGKSAITSGVANFASTAMNSISTYQKSKQGSSLASQINLDTTKYYKTGGTKYSLLGE